MGWDGTERRKKKRYGIKNSVVRYRKSALPLIGSHSDPLLLLNISASGCHFMSREPLEEDQTVTLKIEAPPLASALSVKARIVWIRPSVQTQGMYRVGLNFTRVSGSARQILKDLLDTAVLDNVEVP